MTRATAIFSAVWLWGATCISVSVCWRCGQAAIPCPTQADAWPADQRERYERLVATCDFETVVSSKYTSSCMQRRDRYMVDHASLLIAVFDGSPGGTQYTVQYAMGRGLDIVDLPVVTARSCGDEADVLF